MALNTHSLDLELSSTQYAYISDASQTGLDLSTAFTIEAWVKLEQLPSSAGSVFTVCSKYQSGASAKRSYALWLNTFNKVEIAVSDDGSSGSGHFINGETDAAFFDAGDVGNWVHVAVSVDVATETVTVYRNGSSRAFTKTGSMGASIYNSNYQFMVGAINDSTNYVFLFDGLIDDLRVWNDVRTSTEISNNYQLQLVGNEDNLVGYWRFNNNALDETSNNNDLTLSGSPVYSTSVPFPGSEDGINSYKTLLGVGF